jgi:hypothetical protein
MLLIQVITAIDQTFRLTASKVNEMLFINRISLISSQAIARIRLSALH